MKRRDFIRSGAVVGVGTYAAKKLGIAGLGAPRRRAASGPVVLSTWNFGLRVNEVSWKLMSDGSNSLDAVEQGIWVVENDPKITSIGYGGLPDETMRVTLDAAIMDWRMNCGSVGCIEGIKNPISVARKVMERTRHVMLSGKGAHDFAVAHGFKSTDLLTDESRETWLHWKENMSDTDNWLGPHDMDDLMDNHDTIGLLAMDKKGRISGGTSTSGMAWKIHGRIGDSPIIGVGLYVDGKIGAAASTGVGEANMRIVGSFLVVESMNNGQTPQEACETAIRRAIEVHSKQIKADKEFQLAYIALNRNGEVGGAAIRKGFQYAVYKDGINKLVDAKFLYTQ